MILEFVKEHNSITGLNRTELPAFTVLTGVNGSGKSHLLEAIENQSVKVSDIKQPRIVRFDYETFKLDNEPVLNAHQLTAEREAAWQYYQQEVRNQVQSWRAPLGEEYDSIKIKCTQNSMPFWYTRHPGISNYRDSAKRWFGHRRQRDNQHAQGIYTLAKQLPYSIDDIDHDEFVSNYKPFLFKNDFLPHQLGKVFWDYYVKLRQNQVNEFENEKHGKSYPCVSEEEFLKKNGQKPWEVVNQILRQFETMTYKVNSPEGNDIFANYQLKLCHTEQEGLEINFNQLSSGEKVLMALVASVYKSEGDKTFPDILLLDEVDTSLHPSMIKNMLEVIRNIFLRHEVNVILVTHSPTTIALVSEDSIYLMRPKGDDRIKKSERNEALSILTQGFATIEEGLTLFDEVARRRLTVITEGNNVSYLKKALELEQIHDVEVLDSFKAITGKNQLRTLFDFFQKAPHDSKVLFVWDCDVGFSLQDENNTFPFIFARNDNNDLAKKGIENLFPKELFSDYIKRVHFSKGSTLEEFDSTRKSDFEAFVLGRNNPSDFALFKPFINKVKDLCGLQCDAA